MFDFQAIQKQMFGVHSMPEDTVRVSPTGGVSFPKSVSQRLSTGKYTRKSGQPALRVLIEWDSRNQAIRLSGSQDSGFAFAIRDEGTAQGNLGVSFRKMGILTGDYVLVEGEYNIYKLV